jgi:low affinity Fe/Cu permease
MKRGGIFARFAKIVAFATGQPWAFGSAAFIIIIWACTGPLFHYSDTWQLVINTGTTIVTFLMVFLIQNTQNRDSQAIHLKLDELIRATRGAHTAVIDSEQLSDSELSHIKAAYTQLAEAGRNALRTGAKDTGTPEVIIDTFDHKPN